LKSALWRSNVPRAIQRDAINRRRRFKSEDIELCVRWYITYRLSYRDLVAMMAERGVIVTHTTVMRWVIHFVPEYIQRWERWVKPVGRSWRVDETYISVRDRKHYLHRAIDKSGKTVESMLSEARTIPAAQAFFRRVVRAAGSGWPEKITWTSITRATGRCSSSVERMLGGNPSSCEIGGTSTMSSSRITGQ
jgi:transposase-like protein